MRNFKPTKVVALDATGQAITWPLHSWTARFNERKGTLTLASGAHKRQYQLTTEVLYLAVVGQKDEVDLGKTLGRMALTGIATNGFAHGKGVAGAVMDLAMRGTATNAWLRCEMVLSDLSVVSFEAKADQIKASSALVQALGDAARQRLNEVNDFLRRLKADGERALPELDATIRAQRTRLQQLADDAEHGPDFASRDRAREQLARVQTDLADNESVRAALIVEFATDQLGPMHGLLGRVMKGLMWTALGLAAVIAFIIYAVNTPASQSTQHQPKTETRAPTTGVPRQTAPTVTAISPGQAAPPSPKGTVAAPQIPQSLGSQASATQATPISRPSFDCAKASTRVEKLICADPDLGEADTTLATTYEQALATTDDTEKLRKEQIAWRRNTRDICPTSRCVLQAYADRTDLLNAALP